MGRVHGAGGGADGACPAPWRPPGPTLVRLQLCRLEQLPREGPPVPRRASETPEAALPGYRLEDRPRKPRPAGAVGPQPHGVPHPRNKEAGPTLRNHLWGLGARRVLPHLRPSILANRSRHPRTDVRPEDPRDARAPVHRLAPVDERRSPLSRVAKRMVGQLAGPDGRDLGLRGGVRRGPRAKPGLVWGWEA